MKVEVTDLKAPNDANTTVADATGVQAKLWINKTDTGAPDMLVTDATITGGVLSVPLEGGTAPEIDNVNKTSQTSSTNGSTGTTTTVSSFAHPGGLLLVFHTLNAGTRSAEVSASATFDGSAMTRIGTAFEPQTDDAGVQVDVFSIDATAKTGTVAVTLGTTHNTRSIYVVPVGEGITVRNVNENTVSRNNSVALSLTNNVTTQANDLVIQCARWRVSAAFVDGYSSGQTEVLGGDSRSDLSKRTATGTSTTMSVTMDAAHTNNIIAAVAVSLIPSGIAAAVGDPVLGVAKWTVATDDYFFPIDTTVQEDV